MGGGPSRAAVRPLPPELLERVLSFLPPAHLKAAVLVCRLWRRVGARPHLWASLRLRVDGWRGAAPQVLRLPRLARVTSLLLQGCLTDALLRAVARHPAIRELEVANADLSRVDLALLGRTLRRIEVVKLRFRGLEPRQIEILLEGLAGRSRLRSLDLTCQGVELMYCEAALLAAALANLDTLNIFLTADQAREVVPRLSHRMRNLNMFYCSLSSVEAATLAATVARMDTADLTKTKLTEAQVQALFAALAAARKVPKEVKLAENDLSSVEAAVVEAAVARLATVDLRGTRLTPEQATAVVRAAGSEGSCLRSLKVTASDLRGVEEVLVARAVRRLEKLELCRKDEEVEEVEEVAMAPQPEQEEEDEMEEEEEEEEEGEEEEALVTNELTYVPTEESLCRKKGKLEKVLWCCFVCLEKTVM